MSRATDAPPRPSADAPRIHWFRRDLRLADNPALTAAAERGLPIEVVDTDGAGPLPRLDPDLAGAVDDDLRHRLRFQKGAQRREVVIEDGGVVHHRDRS